MSWSVITAPHHALAAKKSVTVAEVFDVSAGRALNWVIPVMPSTRCFYDHHLKPNLAMGT